MIFLKVKSGLAQYATVRLIVCQQETRYVHKKVSSPTLSLLEAKMCRLIKGINGVTVLVLMECVVGVW